MGSGFHKHVLLKFNMASNYNYNFKLLVVIESPCFD